MLVNDTVGEMFHRWTGIELPVGLVCLERAVTAMKESEDVREDRTGKAGTRAGM
jgi:hypothetical protein